VQLRQKEETLRGILKIKPAWRISAMTFQISIKLQYPICAENSGFIDVRNRGRDKRVL